MSVRVPGRHAAIRRRLARWYATHRRDLPWRRDRDPYRVWVSEVMLQQTRVEVVAPAYERFLSALPDLRALARASEDDVLSLWSGLGYYSRARSLHRAAQQLVAAGAAGFPRDAESARRLPGVGSYTAAAVLSIAYGVRLAAVDGNVVRVLSRLDRLALPDGRGEPHASFATALLDRARPGEWNQAVMELGQTVCLPRAPRCDACPLAADCRAHRDGVVEHHPPVKPRRAVEDLDLELVVLSDRAGRLVLERGAFAHLPHLWLPPLAETARRDLAAGLLREGGRFRHAILHRRFDVRVRAATLTRSALDRAARRRDAAGERAVFDAGALAGIGRSSLLTKALRHAAPA